MTTDNLTTVLQIKTYVRFTPRSVSPEIWIEGFLVFDDEFQKVINVSAVSGNWLASLAKEEPKIGETINPLAYGPCVYDPFWFPTIERRIRP